MKIGVLTSGGDAPGMNAAIRAVVRCGIDAGFEVYGIKRGYEGLLDGEIEQMNLSSVGDILHRGGTILKTARSERFSTEEGVKRSKVILGTFGIDALIVIGGDGSMRGALELSKLGVNVMCLPGTIDNDLAYTDYTIGFDTAVNTVLDAISKVRDTSSAHERNTIIEVMGRHCGDIALYAGVGGGAEAVLIPEVEADVNRVCRKILQGAGRGKLNSIIINAEGSGVSSEELAKEIAEVTGRETRIVVLSYLQRGGVPTLDDRLLASQSGAKAIELIQSGIKNRAIGTVNGKIQAFEIEGALAEKPEFDHELYELIDVLSK
ncbi:MAG: 6-phosphofructokinase [[Eubacterium] sulci]|jgi:6-phosphofructokinase|nr:6-phosphofructokinase [[Eubacterium] sulci]